MNKKKLKQFNLQRSKHNFTQKINFYLPAKMMAKQTKMEKIQLKPNRQGQSKNIQSILI